MPLTPHCESYPIPFTTLRALRLYKLLQKNSGSHPTNTYYGLFLCVTLSISWPKKGPSTQNTQKYLSHFASIGVICTKYQNTFQFPKER